MQIFNDVTEIIGNTPIVKINKVGEGKANIFAKLEFFNPGGSIKDRMALFILNEAEKNGLIGKEVVENSSGNTGAALAMIAAVKGYKSTITIPDKMSSEKINLMKAFGAEVVVTKTDVPHESEESYYSVARRISKERGAYYPDQYNNPDNIRCHYETTGPEIWSQMEGKIDILIAGIGTGGTISGTGKYLKEMNPRIEVIGVDPEGSIFYDYFKSGKIIEPHVYNVEGIGEDYLVKAVDFSVIDDIIRVDDKESFLMARRLAREEGIFAGGSSGSAMVAALKVAEHNSDKNILVIFPDSGYRYMSKIYNDEWMKEHGFMENEK
ncbi:MAG: cysteine synthase family protein [Candidatus Thermoplasmatota archaeon]|jgi:cystathionine beta-synthase|nr:cysteine synthase family protein [Candidatus Thermoplasmatota archaeon]MCL5789913.1 cysteine synthase family protein [Candidatus Thermoplasmatota archaeon]